MVFTNRGRGRGGIRGRGRGVGEVAFEPRWKLCLLNIQN